MQRETTSDGTVVVKSERCTISFRRLGPGVVLMRIVGYDSGEFGNAPFEEMHALMAGFTPAEVFMDLSEAFGARTQVREEWTNWFRSNQAVLRRANILVGSKYIEIAVAMAKLFSRTGELIQLYSSAAAFQEAIARAIAA